MYRNWCFTNHFPKNDKLSWQDYVPNCETIFKAITEKRNIRYLHCGMEMGKEESPHLQGYVQLVRGTNNYGIRKLMDMPIMHFEPQWAELDARADDYCSKEHLKEWFWGERVKQGQRSDLEVVAKSIVSGEKSLDDVANESPRLFAQYHRSFESLRSHVKHKGRLLVCTCRKYDSKLVPEDAFWYNNNWSGYCGESDIVYYLTDKSANELHYLCNCKHPYVNVGYQRLPFYGVNIWTVDTGTHWE